MTVQSQTQNVEADEKEEARLAELYKKTEKTEDEIKEFDQLKKDRSSRYQKRIDMMKSETLAERQARERAETRAKELEEELQRERKAKVEPKKIIKDTVDISGEKYYTDDALVSMISAGEISESDAYKHQRERDKKEAAEIAYQRIKSEQTKISEESIREQDAKNVLERYPHFNKNHPDFNPEDPLYKLTIEMYQDGYYSNPRGLSKATEKAEQILGKNIKNVDITDEISMARSSAPGRPEPAKKELTLSEFEKEQAYRMYRDIKNPATGRNYTEQEAIAKATKAKNSRRIR